MKLKSMILTPALLLLNGIAIFAIIRLAGGAPLLPWIGVALAAGAMPAFITYVMATQSLARTSARMPGLIAVSLGGSLLAALGSVLTDASIVPAALAALGTGVLFWYIYVYSSFGGRDSAALALGGTLPDFTLEQADGTPVTRADFAGKPALFLFYRGNWCPLCMAQIKEIADQYKRLADQGVAVALVSPQPHAQTEALAKKFDVPFQFLVDKDLKTAKDFDIFAADGTPLGIVGYDSDTVMPTVLATDASGTIIFLDQTDNYRVRPEPETFLKIFEAPAAA